MKLNTVLASAVFSTILSTTGMAADMDTPTPNDFAVRLELSGGYNYFGTSGANIDGTIIAGGGSVSMPLGPVSAQIDALIQYEDFGKNRNVTNYSGGLHLGWRDANVGLLGLSGSLGKFKASGGAPSVNQQRIGVEAEYYIDAFTAGADAGYVRLSAGGASSDGVYGKLTGKYYTTDNFRFDANAGLYDFDSKNTDAVFASAGAEYKLDDYPVSLTARWNGTFFSGAGFKPKSHMVMAGIRIYLGGNGQNTVKSYDRSNFAESCTIRSGFGQSFC